MRQRSFDEAAMTERIIVSAQKEEDKRNYNAGRRADKRRCQMKPGFLLAFLING
jgi:hypothetical protein